MINVWQKIKDLLFTLKTIRIKLSLRGDYLDIIITYSVKKNIDSKN